LELPSLTDAQHEEALSLFPNPANDYLEIKVELNQSSRLELSLYDLQGSIVRSFGKYDFTKKSKNVTLSIADIQPGVYMFHATDNEAIRIVQKMLIMR
jgi:hypothetical protein